MCWNCGQNKNMGNDSKAGTLAWVAKFALLGHFIICTWLLYCVEPKAKSNKWGRPNPFGFWYLCNFKEVKWNKCDFKMALTLLWSNILLKLSRSDSFFPILMKNGQCMYVVDVLWGQPIKLIQVVSTSEFHEYWWNDPENIFLVPSAFCRASEARTQSRP